jgi:Undecaprenyl-phosphate glucose phosphotransferase
MFPHGAWRTAVTVVREIGTAGRLAASDRRPPLMIPISLNVVSAIVAALDVCWIVLLGIAVGLVYDAIALGGNGQAGNHVGTGIAVAILYSALAHAGGLYQGSNLVRKQWQVRHAVLSWLAAFLFLAMLAFVLKIGAMFSRGEMLLFFFLGLAVSALARVAVACLCLWVLSSRTLSSGQVILVGSADELADNATLSALEKHGYAISAVFPLVDDKSQVLSDAEWKDRMRNVVAYTRENRIDEVILAIPWNRLDIIGKVENELRILPIPVKLIPDKIIGQVLTSPVLELGPTMAVELQRAPLSTAQRKLKGSIDQLLAILGLLFLMPFMAIIAAAIRLESPGPAMFVQTRVGFNGRPFRIYKFRTMRAGNDDGPVVVQATRQDKRVTRLGRLLRKLSIDEIPQLVNVIRGEMSLVGPRPHALAHDNEYDRLIATYAMRHKMKPGITGWAQVNGFRGETPEVGMMERRVESDIWYIEYWSLWLDVRILLLTLVRFLKSDNAY